MDTWEVIKNLKKNTNDLYRLIGGTKNLNYLGIIIQNFNGCLQIRDKDGLDSIDLNYVPGLFINGIWEKIQKPVTWQEAIEAWIKGKEIRLEINGKTIKFFGAIKDDFIKGKWYIED